MANMNWTYEVIQIKAGRRREDQKEVTLLMEDEPFTQITLTLPTHFLQVHNKVTLSIDEQNPPVDQC